MDCIDLTLSSGGTSNQLTASLASPLGQQVFPVAPPPAKLLACQKAWLHRFLAYHDTSRVSVSAAAMTHYGQEFCAALESWLEDPSWRPLQQALLALPGRPLRLRCEGQGMGAIERFPWEALGSKLQRPIWRLEGALQPSITPRRRLRRPRLLLVVGDESALPLEDDLRRMQLLQQKRRIDLTVQRSSGGNLEALRLALRDPEGWDGLIFLGHSSSNRAMGGLLQIGEGSWISGASIAEELAQAARLGLPLVLLNSCSGIDLARTCTGAGIPWAFCFREPVPTAAASLAFSVLLEKLEQGLAFEACVAAVRRTLDHSGPVGSHLLLSVFCTSTAEPPLLPLRWRRRLLLRLRRSHPSQAAAAAVALALAAVGEIAPHNPISMNLLDGRLDLQQSWRALTAQPGPAAPALPVLLLQRRVTQAPSQSPSGGPQARISQSEVAAVLERTPPARVPVVGLDLVIDQPAPGTAALEAVLRRQQRRQVIAGFFDFDSAETRTGQKGQPLPELQEAGLQSRSLSLGTPDVLGRDPAAAKPAPLQIWSPITTATFAGSLVEALRPNAPSPRLPVNAVIDWSLDWSRLIREVSMEELPRLAGPVLVVGSDGRTDPSRTDLFTVPSAARPSFAVWQQYKYEVPGVIVQAVWIQSLRLGHWLTPLSLTAATALSAGIGVLLAAAVPRRWLRLPLIGAGFFVACPLALQLAVGQRVLVPLLLPLATVSATALLRHD